MRSKIRKSPAATRKREKRVGHIELFLEFFNEVPNVHANQAPKPTKEQKDLERIFRLDKNRQTNAQLKQLRRMA